MTEDDYWHIGRALHQAFTKIRVSRPYWIEPTMEEKRLYRAIVAQLCQRFRPDPKFNEYEFLENTGAYDGG